MRRILVVDDDLHGRLAMRAWGRAAPKICRNPCRYNKHAVRSAGWNDTNTLLDGESFSRLRHQGSCHGTFASDSLSSLAQRTRKRVFWRQTRRLDGGMLIRVAIGSH
jgi:hypothetical protein